MDPTPHRDMGGHFMNDPIRALHEIGGPVDESAKLKPGEKNETARSPCNW